MRPEPEKSELDKLMKDVPASSIPMVKPPEEVKADMPNPDEVNRLIWSAASNALLSDYKYGENLAKYGTNEMAVQKFFKRLSGAICDIVTNEYQKQAQTSIDLKPHYEIIENAFALLSKEIDKKSLKDFNTLSIIAALQGFITNYTTKKERNG